MKLAIFSDIHFGDNKDSKTRLSTTLQFIKQFITICKQEKVDRIIFLGDWFDNRKTINTITYNISYYCVKLLSNEFPIVLLVGNHDIPSINNNPSTSNINIFKEIKNVTIVNDKKIEIVDNKKLLFLPFNYNILSITEKYDYAFGHFEFNGATVAAGTLDDKCKINISDIYNLSSLIFTGHYHINKEYTINNSKIISVGSPFELDWGDYNNQKGIYILDTNTSIYKFIPNNYSPKHIRIYWSKKDNIDKNIITNNYIKLIIDSDYEYNKVLETINIINNYDPVDKCKVEFIFSLNTQLKQDNINIETKNIDILEYINTYIDKMSTDIFTDINKDELKSIIKKYYEEV